MCRMKTSYSHTLTAALLLAVVMAPGVAELPTDPAAPPTAPKPASAENSGDATPSAVVIEVAGSVDWALPEASPLTDEGWTPCRVNDTYEPGIQIRTGLRSHVNLWFGETTVVSIRSATYAGIDQFYRSADTETVRVGLAYGTVRGGSTEGPIKADVQVDSTIATLSKRGTEGWQMWVEPVSGKFRVSLADSGLVEATRKLTTGQSRSKNVRPGEYATAANMANLWIDQARFDDTVQFFPAETITANEVNFITRTAGPDGYQAAAGGQASNNLTGRRELRPSRATARRDLPATAVIVPEPVKRPEGNFGNPSTFRVLRPVRRR